MKIDYQSLEKKIKVSFKNKDLLIKSLTHKSFDKEENNEKIEFLGDRVLGLVIAKKLLEIYPNEKEGILDKKFAALVNKKTCLEIAKKLELQKYILTLKHISFTNMVCFTDNSICFHHINNSSCSIVSNLQFSLQKRSRSFAFRSDYIQG